MTKHMLYVATLAAVVVAVATPGVAWADHRNDPERPGSVLVFHKFIRGTVDTGDQGTLPKSEFEISVVCPSDLDCLNTGGLVESWPDFPRVKLMAHWVCPGDAENVCNEVDFKLETTVNGTVRINPENVGELGIDRTHNVPPPPCEKGFLILWVIGEAFVTGEPLGGEEPIKLDSLIGDAILRETCDSASAYNAVPIQAGDDLLSRQSTDSTDGDLEFDGNDYKELPERIFGTVRYDDPDRGIATSVTLLTIDVFSNRRNPRTVLDMNFYNEAEVGISTHTEFVCWRQVPLAEIPGGLNTSHGRKGLLESADALQFFEDDPGSFGEDATVLAIIHTTEPGREYAYSVYHSEETQETSFFIAEDTPLGGLPATPVPDPLDPIVSDPVDAVEVPDLPLLP
jgi:hypothetical protein